MEGAYEAPGYGGTPAYRGDAETIQVPPLKLLQHQSARRGSDQAPVKALAGCGMWPSDEGVQTPWTTPANGGSHGAVLQESGFRVWPAAIDPQTPTVPGAEEASHPQSPQRRHQGGARNESPP
ncbi:hypothetical protein N7530_013007 [Penicillium desertorum]|uniref:Uncharacterized protein n=1 Tax=Penicillium desertorum TaxID=1303715 RepID=A0A9W9WCV3_9EURO|nr:hypothetical protein N7530_013007 [Penicillium desertorum]